MKKGPAAEAKETHVVDTCLLRYKIDMKSLCVFLSKKMKGLYIEGCIRK